MACSSGYVDDASMVPFWKQTPENIVAYLEGKPLRVLEPESGLF